MIALIDYGAGNTNSISNVLTDLNADFILTNQQKEINEAEKIILPGVGEASFAMTKLKELKLVEVLKTTSKPFLGICLGMQLLCEQTDEGQVDCLGIIKIRARKFDIKKIKVPHMGWNSVIKKRYDELTGGMDDDSFFYFAHSYYVPLNEFSTTICRYEIDFSSSVKYKNFYGVQFHPEKSAANGINIIKNFLAL
jgi:glutamine amidotransferase